MDNFIRKMAVLLLGCLPAVACQSYLDLQPRASLISENVFSTDETAEATVLGLYSMLTTAGFSNGSAASITVLAGLSSDELVNQRSTGAGEVYQQFNDHALTPLNTAVQALWAEPYRLVYRATIVIEGLEGNNSVTTSLRDQLLGEAHFMRAFGHFYLANLFGEIPLTLTSDYRINAALPRAGLADVYASITSDLQTAQQLLAADYASGGGKRIRVNRWAATALLARVYLYQENWVAAEREASAVIGNESLFVLEPAPAGVFLKDSREAIWQLVRYAGNAEANPYEGRIFTITGNPSLAALRNDLVNLFEAGDLRRGAWVGQISSGGQTYYYSSKYKALADAPVTEYGMILRLAEQYLIRAEAHARLGNAQAAVADLNAVRGRAGAPLIDGEGNIDLPALIEKERVLELACEWGHRWFDLKRTNRADVILAPLNSRWKPWTVRYPIPESQLLANPSMTDHQNEGY